MQFTVRFQIDGSYNVTVDAEDIERARELAQEEFDKQWQKLIQSNKSEIELDEGSPYQINDAKGEVVWE